MLQNNFILLAELVFTICIFLYGIIGSMKLMSLGLIDSVYYTVITIAAVGYGDIYPLTPLEKIFTISLSLAGIGIIALIIFLENVSYELKRSRRHSKMNK